MNPLDIFFAGTFLFGLSLFHILLIMIGTIIFLKLISSMVNNYDYDRVVISNNRISGNNFEGLSVDENDENKFDTRYEREGLIKRQGKKNKSIKKDKGSSSNKLFVYLSLAIISIITFYVVNSEDIDINPFEDANGIPKLPTIEVPEIKIPNLLDPLNILESETITQEGDTTIHEITNFYEIGCVLTVIVRDNQVDNAQVKCENENAIDASDERIQQAYFVWKYENGY